MYSSNELVDKLKKENKISENERLFVLINGFTFILEGVLLNYEILRIENIE